MSNALNKKSSKTPVGLSAEIFTEILSKLSAVYLLLMTGVFPLFVTDMYYNILKDKYYFFFYATVSIAAICLIVLLIGILGGALRRQKDGTRPLAELFRPTVTDVCFAAFLLVTTISTVASKWPYEAFWGTNGRLQGLFFYLIAALGWIIVTKFYRPRKWHLYFALSVGILLCLWAVSDYLGVDILGWRADADDFLSMLAFTSSIGNTNTFTAIASLYAGIFAVMALQKKTNAFFFVGFFIVILSLITGISDNAALAVVGLFALLPFYVLRDREKIGKFLFLVSLFCAAMALMGFVTPVWTLTRIVPKTIRSLFRMAALDAPQLFLALTAVFAILGVVLQCTASKNSRYRATPFIILWGSVCALGLISVILVLIDANTAGTIKISRQLKNYLVFSDKWGSNRGFAWRSAAEFFKEFSLFEKLFGSGPETYGIFMTTNYYYEMIDFMNKVFDSPHSEPLQYLFTTGILGFLSLYTMMISGIIRGIRKNGVAAACAFGCIAYLFASLVNISTPISTPLLFLTLAVTMAVKENEKQI